ncbi:MAG TPA: hypothetical protein VKH42_02405 [Vicinamibacterales bacterium]|nr:hypothetical protein [Vicinamibacterales bacterium]
MNLQIGGFVPAGSQPNGGPVINGRADGDVLAADIDFLDFRMSDFSGFTVNGEWLFAVTPNIEAGLGIGYYSHSVPSVYADAVNENGTEIEQELKLRIAPFSATVRWLPIGNRATVVPYVGAGLGVFMWRYEETGQFVDFRDNSIFSGSFSGSGAATGPVILGGVRVPVGNWGIGGELRYQHAVADLPTDQGFAGEPVPRIDLGGFNILFSINVKF